MPSWTDLRHHASNWSPCEFACCQYARTISYVDFVESPFYQRTLRSLERARWTPRDLSGAVGRERRQDDREQQEPD